MTITASSERGLHVRPATVVVGVVALVAGSLIGAFGWRHDDAAGAQQRVGDGYVGVGVASLSAGGHSFVSVDGHTPWYGADGTLHEGTFPSCLPRTTTVRGVHWADVTVATPSGGTERVVLYVDCRSSG